MMLIKKKGLAEAEMMIMITRIQKVKKREPKDYSIRV